MATFPILTSSAPEIDGFEDNYSDEAVITASQASGHPLKISQYTFDPRTFSFVMSNVSQDDKVLVAAFYQLYKDQNFDWVNDQDSTVYDVVFAQRPSFTVVGDDKQKWRIGVYLRQDTPEVIAYVPSTTSYFYGGPAMVEVEDLSPGVSILDRPVFALGMPLTITGADILTKGAPAGIDNSNTVVIILKKNDGTPVFSKTYNTATQPPDGGLGSLGTALVTTLDEDEWLELDVTQIGTANMPAFSLVLEGTFAQVAAPITSTVEIEDLASGISISNRPLMAFGRSATITGLYILTKGTPVGIDNSNTVVITIKTDGGTTVVTKTYNTITQPPDNGRADLGTILSGTLDDDEWLEISVTQTGTADMPIFSVILDGYYN